MIGRLISDRDCDLRVLRSGGRDTFKPIPVYVFFYLER